jgi:hypothetical protein
MPRPLSKSRRRDSNKQPPILPGRFNLVVVERGQRNIALLNIHRLAATLGVTPTALMAQSGSR